MEWDRYFSSGRVKTYLGFDKTRLIGYFELEFQEKNAAEIKFFGLFPQYVGSGLGGMLLSHTVDIARANNVKRIWLHTCSNDSKSAKGNYLARGFRVYKEEENLEYIPDKREMLNYISEFYSAYIDRFAGLNPL